MESIDVKELLRSKGLVLIDGTYTVKHNEELDHYSVRVVAEFGWLKGLYHFFFRIPARLWSDPDLELARDLGLDIFKIGFMVATAEFRPHDLKKESTMFKSYPVEYLEEIHMWLDDVLETDPFDINLYSAIRKGNVWNKV